MVERVYTDFSVTAATYFLKFTGAYFTKNNADEIRRKIGLLHIGLVTLFGVYVNSVNVKHFWGNDFSYCSYCCCNLLLMSLGMCKVAILRYRRFDLADLVAFAERHFWHYDYSPEEWAIIEKYRTLCKYWVYYVVSVTIAIMFGYASVPLMANRGRNKSERELVFRMWVSWPVYETPYYELMFCLQIFIVGSVAAAYVCPDTYMIIFNLHMICHFRLLQKRILDFWQRKKEDIDEDVTLARYTLTFKKCVARHQLLITFCEKMERVFSLTIFMHFLVFSAYIGLDGYEILLPTTPIERRVTIVFLVVGSFGHLGVLSYSCDYIIEESTNIITTIYRGSWYTMPMNQMGKILRLDMRMVMMKGLRPCCLTAAGFFAVSLETFTKLASSAFSYFALMRESLAFDAGE